MNIMITANVHHKAYDNRYDNIPFRVIGPETWSLTGHKLCSATGRWLLCDNR